MSNDTQYIMTANYYRSGGPSSRTLTEKKVYLPVSLTREPIKMANSYSSSRYYLVNSVK